MYSIMIGDKSFPVSETVFRMVSNGLYWNYCSNFVTITDEFITMNEGISLKEEYKVLDVIVSFLSQVYGEAVLDDEDELNSWNNSVGSYINSVAPLCEYSAKKGEYARANEGLLKILEKLVIFRQTLEEEKTL